MDVVDMDGCVGQCARAGTSEVELLGAAVVEGLRAVWAIGGCALVGEVALPAGGARGCSCVAVGLVVLGAGEVLVSLVVELIGR